MRCSTTACRNLLASHKGSFLRRVLLRSTHNAVGARVVASKTSAPDSSWRVRAGMARHPGRSRAPARLPFARRLGEARAAPRGAVAGSAGPRRRRYLPTVRRAGRGGQPAASPSVGSPARGLRAGCWRGWGVGAASRPPAGQAAAEAGPAAPAGAADDRSQHDGALASTWPRSSTLAALRPGWQPPGKV
jgi:hypothetical protein